VGVQAPPELDGRSRWSALCSETYAGRDHHLLHLEIDTFSKIALRSGDIKLVIDRARGETNAYDLARDRSERSALGLGRIFETWGLRRRLRSMDAELQDRAFQPTISTEIREDVEDQLRALGYLE
jgi:hypothetical protein